MREADPSPWISRLAALAVACLLLSTTVFASQDALLVQVRAAVGEGRFEHALELASQAIAGEQPDLDVYLLRAVAHYHLGNEGDASADLDRYVAAVGVDVGATVGLPLGLPEAFVAWATTASASVTRPAELELPEVSLADLEIGVEIREVSAHFVLDVEIVRIPVIVEGEDGDFMSGLSATQFRVVEDSGAPQRVDELISESEPTSVGILVDASGAIGDRSEVVLNAVGQLLDTLKKEDEVFLLVFADEARFLSPFTSDRRALREVVSGYRPGRDRALYDGLALGLIQMRSAQFDKKALIVLTAGDDVGSKSEAAVVQRAAQREAVSIHGVVLEPGVPRWRPAEASEAAVDAPAAPAEFLQRLVHNTGGLVALRPGNDEQFGGLAGWLEAATGDISDYINHQYLILHESRNPPPRGQWRPLMVNVSEPHDRVRFRSGFVR